MTHESNYLSAKKPTNVLDLTRGCTENNYTHIIGEGLVHILRSNTALYFRWKQILSGRGRNCFILKFNVVNLTFPSPMKKFFFWPDSYWRPTTVLSNMSLKVFLTTFSSCLLPTNVRLRHVITKYHK